MAPVSCWPVSGLMSEKGASLGNRLPMREAQWRWKRRASGLSLTQSPLRGQRRTGAGARTDFPFNPGVGGAPIGERKLARVAAGINR